MDFDKSRCYSALNADELKPGDKVVVADDLVTLKRCVKDNSPIDTIRMIGEEDYIYRFGVKDNTATFALAYLVERKENCTNCGEGKWDAEHKKILCDPVHYGNGNVVFRNHEIEVCRCWKPKTEQKAEKHYRPFRDIDELIKVWDAKIGTPKWGTDGDLTMPHIWVREKGCNKSADLITCYGSKGITVRGEGIYFDTLFTMFEFLDGSPCGVEE